MSKLIVFSCTRYKAIYRNQDQRQSESGQGILEYALIFSFVVVLLVVLLYFFGDRVEIIYQSILTDLSF